MATAARKKKIEPTAEEATVLLYLSFGLPRTSAALDNEMMSGVDAAADRLSGAKQLLAGSVEYRMLDRARAAIIKRIEDIELEVEEGMLGKGQHLMSLATIEYAEARLIDGRDTMWRPRVEAFMEAYPAIIERAKLPKEKGGLGSTFREEDFDPPEIVRRRCRCEWTYGAPPGAPMSLTAVSAAFFAEQREKSDAQWRDSGGAISQGLRGRLLTLVDRMANVLKPRADGKRKGVRDDLINEMNEYLELLPARNVVGDATADRLAARAKTIMAGVDVSTLGDEAVRTRVQQKMEKLAEDARKAVGTTKRRVVFNDDDE